MASHAKRVKARPAAPPAKKPKRAFFGEVIGELRKAHWPTRQEALRLSILVLIICVVVGAILGALDYGFTKLVGALLLGS